VLESGFSSNIGGCGDIVEVLIDLLLSSSHVLKVTSSGSLVNLLRSHNLVMRVIQELVPVGKPSSESRKRE
jgi:hypothetical protein